MTQPADPSEFLSFLHKAGLSAYAGSDEGDSAPAVATDEEVTSGGYVSGGGPASSSFHEDKPASVTSGSDVVLCRETVTSKPPALRTMLLVDPEDAIHLTPGLSFLCHQIEFFEASPQDVRDRFSKGGTKYPVTEGQIGIRCHHCAHLPDSLRANGAVAFPNTLSTVYQAVRNWQRHHFMKCPQISDEIKAKFKSFKRQHSAKSTDYWVASCQRRGLYDGDNDDPTNKGIRLERKKEEEQEKDMEQQSTTTKLLCATIEPEPMYASSTANGTDGGTDDAASDDVAHIDESYQSDLDDFIDIDIEPEPIEDINMEPIPVHSSSSSSYMGAEALSSKPKSKSKRCRPENSWLQDHAANFQSFAGAYRDNDDDASLPSIASSCTGTYSTGATTYYSASSRYVSGNGNVKNMSDSSSVNSTSCSRSASATADLLSALNMHQNSIDTTLPGVCDTDIQLPPRGRPDSSMSTTVRPPSRHGSPVSPKTRLSPDPSLGQDEELPRIDEHDEDMDNTDHTSHTAQSTNTMVHSNAGLLTSSCSSSVNGSTNVNANILVHKVTNANANILVHKVDIAHDLVQTTLNINIFAESSTVMPPRDHNSDLVEVGRELFEHFSGFPLTDDVYRDLCQAGRIGRDLDGANVIYSNLRSMGYPSSVCGLVTTLCLASQPNYLIMATKIYPRTFSSVAEVKNELQLMLDQPDLWFFDADIHTLEDRLTPPSRKKKAKF